ncbi:hypothetical protein [Mycolicibacterium sp. P9-64]|uniref:hypothetical protein n=1 Tax=Mycolicibacterium sp. P9-64 TaxID=2024612 RepID=UPI001F5BAD2D|nr:hypothetical protein [Mycolicibacterium sp. P9-64]
MKDSASAIGLYRGEGVECGLLDRRLASVITNYRSWLNRMVIFLGWILAGSQAIYPLPYIVLPQRLRLVRKLPGGAHPPRRVDGRQHTRQSHAQGDDRGRRRGGCRGRRRAHT